MPHPEQSNVENQAARLVLSLVRLTVDGVALLKRTNRFSPMVSGTESSLLYIDG